MVAHLKFFFHDGGPRGSGREASRSCMESGARIRGPEYLTQMWQYIVPELLKAIDTDPELDVKSEHVYALAQCVECMGAGCPRQTNRWRRSWDCSMKTMAAGTHCTRQEARAWTAQGWVGGGMGGMRRKWGWVRVGWRKRVYVRWGGMGEKYLEFWIGFWLEGEYNSEEMILEVTIKTEHEKIWLRTKRWITFDL